MGGRRRLAIFRWAEYSAFVRFFLVPVFITFLGGAADECERRRNEDYSYASSIYVSAMLACSCATGGIGVCLCAVAASAAYEYAITLADRSFADCLKNAK